MKNFTFKKAIMACTLLFSQVSIVLAAPSTPSFAQDAKLKKQIVQSMQHQFERHLKMSLNEIQTEMIQAIEKNRNHFKERGKLTTPILNSIETAQTQILSFTEKEQILASEKENIERAISASNILFFLTRDLASHVHDSPLLVTALSPFTLALDLALLPFEFIISAFTGF